MRQHGNLRFVRETVDRGGSSRRPEHEIRKRSRKKIGPAKERSADGSRMIQDGKSEAAEESGRDFEPSVIRKRLEADRDLGLGASEKERFVRGVRIASGACKL
jgi:hypothetical protein